MRRKAGTLILVAAGLGSILAGPAWVRPAVRPVIRVTPADNPITPTKVALGRRLFYDADLSIDGTMSCGTCHEQRRGFADGNATHGGVHGEPGRRNVPGLANVGAFKVLTWANPSLTRLEAQASVPLAGEHPIEMGMAGQDKALAARLGADPCYGRMFAAAFAGDATITVPRIVQAIATFERTLVSSNAPFDRFRRGEADAIPDSAKRGAGLFFGARFQCASCHAGPNFTDGRYHDIGLSSAAGSDPDRGLIENTGLAADDGRFRTPGLRNVALTAPYLHDGREQQLAGAVLDHYTPGAAIKPEPALRRSPPSAVELANLVAFLGALTDQRFVTNPELALPKVACEASPRN
jgi:cytochrome c peroxidase